MNESSCRTLTFPRLSFRQGQGLFINWLVPNETRVERGQPIYLMQVDDGEFAFPSISGGIIYQKAEANSKCEVGDIVGFLRLEQQDLTHEFVIPITLNQEELAQLHQLAGSQSGQIWLVREVTRFVRERIRHEADPEERG